MKIDIIGSTMHVSYVFDFFFFLLSRGGFIYQWHCWYVKFIHASDMELDKCHSNHIKIINRQCIGNIIHICVFLFLMLLFILRNGAHLLSFFWLLTETNKSTFVYMKRPTSMSKRQLSDRFIYFTICVLDYIGGCLFLTIFVSILNEKKNPKIQSILKFNIAQRSRGKCDQNGFHSMPYHWLGSIDEFFKWSTVFMRCFLHQKKIYNYIKVWCAELCCTAWFPKVTMFDWHVGDRISGFNFKRFVESRRLFVFLLPQPQNAILIRTNWPGIYQEKWNRSSMNHHFSSWCFRLALPKKKWQ